MLQNLRWVALNIDRQRKWRLGLSQIAVERSILVTSPSGVTRNRCVVNDMLLTDCLKEIPCQKFAGIVWSVHKAANFRNSV